MTLTRWRDEKVMLATESISAIRECLLGVHTDNLITADSSAKGGKGHLFCAYYIRVVCNALQNRKNTTIWGMKFRDFCAPDRTRTCNLRIRSPSLYPLSYGGMSTDSKTRTRIVLIWSQEFSQLNYVYFCFSSMTWKPRTCQLVNYLQHEYRC